MPRRIVFRARIIHHIPQRGIPVVQQFPKNGVVQPYKLPGGKAKRGEKPKKTAGRETGEEINGKTAGLKPFMRTKLTRIFTAKKLQGNLQAGNEIQNLAIYNHANPNALFLGHLTRRAVNRFYKKHPKLLAQLKPAKQNAKPKKKRK